MAGWGYDLIGALDATPGTEELRAVAARVERVDTGALADLARRYASLADGMDESVRAVADRGDGVGRAWQGPGADAFARYAADFARAGAGTGDSARRVQGELAGLGRTLAALREEVAGHVSDALDLARARPGQVQAAVATPTARAQAAVDRAEQEVADCARRLRAVADGFTGFSRLRSPDAGVMSASSGATSRWTDRQGAVIGADEPVQAARILDGGSEGSDGGDPDGGSGRSGSDGGGSDGDSSRSGSDGGGSDGGGSDGGGSDVGSGADADAGSENGGAASSDGRTEGRGTGSTDRADGSAASDDGDRGSRADASDPGNAERYDTGSDDTGGADAGGADDGNPGEASDQSRGDGDNTAQDGRDEPDEDAEDADDGTGDGRTGDEADRNADEADQNAGEADDRTGDEADRNAGDRNADDRNADDQAGDRTDDGAATAGSDNDATGTAPSSGQGGVQEWIRQATAILAENGVDAEKMKPEDIATIIEHESGGDPDAVNNWDSNADKGTPSKGLMQTIGPTFEANKLPGHDDITDPVDNIIAAVRYAIKRYGSVSEVPGVEAVARGDSYVGY